jgi:formylglycine-generating enzyme required for sulfatase activity
MNAPIAIAATTLLASCAATPARSAGGTWDLVLDEIADARRSPTYEGLRIEPLDGFLPLGRDPQSRLEEFAHLASGAPPRRRADGRLELDADTGLVFVLLPGGRCRLGARPPDRDHPIGAPNVDPAALADEQPVHDIDLAPFLISKFEMTQGQWQRLAGEQPSVFRPPLRYGARERITPCHPVENVSWEQCSELLARAGLELPTEAQWEYAARGGTATVWWTGDARESLIGAANLADRSARRFEIGGEMPSDWPELDDGFPVHAPVDSLRPNPFGLHHVHGNVWEWCRDRYGEYSVAPRAGDGLREPAGSSRHCVRGGSFNYSAGAARSAARGGDPDGWHSFAIGVRPAADVELRPPR